MQKSDEIMLNHLFGVPDKTVVYKALDIPERLMEDPPSISAYANVVHEIHTKIERCREQMIMSTIRTIGGATYEEITVDQDKVIEILQKSVARKPKVIGQGWNPVKEEVIDWVCPNCYARFSTYHLNNYCSHCGQKLDWEGETK